MAIFAIWSPYYIGMKHNIPIIEDAAEALGSEWYGKRAGSMEFLNFHFMERKR